MQIWGKTKVQCLVRNAHSGVYYAGTRVKGKLKWRTLETDILTVAKARLPKALADMGRKSAQAIENARSIITFGDAATVHLANIHARVETSVRSAGAWCSQQCGDLIEFLAFSGCR